MKAKRIFISGKVQGVGFRYFTHEKARELGLHGWVRNLGDGRVEMLVSGEESKIQEIIKWAHKGPSAAQVEHVEVQETAVQQSESLEPFYIKREGNR